MARLLQRQDLRQRPRRFRWLRVTGLVVLLIVILSASCEAVLERADARLYPPPGQLVDVGGYRLHLNCQGSGSPTVILEEASGLPSLTWALVQNQVSAFTRVCSYDRAGYGWSDPATTRRTGEQVARDLHTLLANARVAGPYLLVGHSMGGLYARVYAAQYPDEVMGMVLIDARPEDATTELAKVGRHDIPGPVYSGILPWLLHLGVGRAYATAGGFDAGLTLFPASMRPALRAALIRPAMSSALAGEFRQQDELESAVRKSGGLGDKPLVVITHGQPLPRAAEETIWQDLQKRQAALSTQGKLIVATQSEHMVQVEQPGLVTDAIRQVASSRGR